MNRHAILGESLLKFSRGRRRGFSVDRSELRTSRNQPRNLAKVFRLVGRDAHGSAWDKRAIHRRQELFRHKAACSVAAFRPRIGKHKMEHADGARRQQLLDRIRDFGMQHPRVRQAGPLDFSTSRANPAPKAFDPQEIPVRILIGNGCEKRPVTTAEIDFECDTAAEDRFEIERSETIGRDEFRRACYGG